MLNFIGIEYSDAIWDDRALEESEARAQQGYPLEKEVPPSFINLTDATMRMVCVFILVISLFIVCLT